MRNCDAKVNGVRCLRPGVYAVPLAGATGRIPSGFFFEDVVLCAAHKDHLVKYGTTRPVNQADFDTHHPVSSSQTLTARESETLEDVEIHVIRGRMLIGKDGTDGAKALNPSGLVSAYQTFRHYKGGLYQTLGEAWDTRRNSWAVVYLSRETGEWWVRPLSMWFETVEKDGVRVPRFREEP